MKPRYLLLAALAVLATYCSIAPFVAADEEGIDFAATAQEKGWLKEYQRGEAILGELAKLSMKEVEEFDIAKHRDEEVALVGGVAPPGATVDLVAAGGFYLRIVDKTGKLPLPNSGRWTVLFKGKIMQVLPANKIIVIEVAREKDWLVVLT